MLKENEAMSVSEKKKYQLPMAEITSFSVGDAIATSGHDEDETKPSLNFDIDPDAGKWYRN